MTQNLLTVSQDEFVKQLCKLPFATLKNLLEGIYDLKWSIRDKFKDFQIHDIERKETKIWYELQRRGYNLKSEDFKKWLKSLYKRKYINIRGKTN